MSNGELERSVAQLQAQSSASQQLIVHLLALVALEHPLGDWVFKYLDAATARKGNPELGKDVSNEIAVLIEQARFVAKSIKGEGSTLS